MHPALQREDVHIQTYFIENGNQSEEQKRMDYQRLNAMIDYCQTSSCLRNYVLAYFGEKVKEPCGHCSNCENRTAKVRITDAAVLIFRYRPYPFASDTERASSLLS